MSKKHDFLDPTEQHTLSEQECEIITFYRYFNKTQRNIIYKLLFEMAFKSTKTIKPKK